MSAATEARLISQEEAARDQEIVTFIDGISGQYIGADKTTKPPQGGEMVAVETSTTRVDGKVRKTWIVQFQSRTELAIDEGPNRIWAETSPLGSVKGLQKPSVKYYPDSGNKNDFTTGSSALDSARQLLSSSVK